MTNNYVETDEILEPTDCLVFEIFANANNKLFILYDYYDKSYFLKGLNNMSNFYSFRCKNISDIRNFIEFVFCYRDEVNIMLNNYKQIPYELKDISFTYLNDMFETNMYDGCNLVSKKVQLNDHYTHIIIEEQLKVIKNFYNKY